MKNSIILTFFLSSICLTISANIEAFEYTETWLQKVEQLAPDHASAQPQKKRRILIFDRITGFDHWVTPHTSHVLKMLGEKSGAYEAIITKDVYFFENHSLKKYDAIILNNTCSKRPDRNLLLDALVEDHPDMPQDDRLKKARDLEGNIISYVEDGGGLMVVHGAIVMQNNSMAFSQLVGGSFDYHPQQQELTLELVDPEHPIVAPFEGKAFVHIDEPYFFNKAYDKMDFLPLLYIDSSKLIHTKKTLQENIKYVSWIRSHGKGRVFYVSPSHNAQSFEDTRMLTFLLNGAQYVAGDLKCDDRPMK